MKLIVCVEDWFGLLFNRRRVSRDCAVVEKISSVLSGETLWMDPYSAELFPFEIPVKADGDFLIKAQPGDFCFLENQDIRPYAFRVEELILFRWNRRYPSDFVFPFEECFGKWQLASRGDFPGNSHDTITMEVYRQ